jgi:Flp pilus assembly protein protease CpaA
MNQALNLALKLIISGLLAYAAVEDIRKREVPYVAGVGIMLFGAFALFWDQHWLLGVFYLVAVMGSRGGLWGLASIVVGLATLAVPGLAAEAYPFILAILFVNTMFSFGAIGQGDAVLAYGLLSIAYENGLWMPLVLLGASILGLLPLIWKRSPKEILDRATKILKNFRRLEEDEEAVKFPWAVIAAVIGLVYLWFVRGVIL